MVTGHSPMFPESPPFPPGPPGPPEPRKLPPPFPPFPPFPALVLHGFANASCVPIEFGTNAVAYTSPDSVVTAATNIVADRTFLLIISCTAF
ncbi:MAG: hypothetical protein GEU26_16260 [Nitrososphaeraceae archaeon]|nr:hypothetical protein [Nitrososphaeraceae archaeon]